MAAQIPQMRAGFDRSLIIERPDGFYWRSAGDGREYGPFATRGEAADDMEFAEADAGDIETLVEAESEIGIADWIDPETGELAEESIPHIEDR